MRVYSKWPPLFLGLGVIAFTVLSTRELFAKRSCSKDNVVCVHTVSRGTTVEFFIENKRNYEVTVDLDVGLTNMKASIKLPMTRAFRPRSYLKVLEIKRIDRNKRWKYDYRFHYVRGSMDAVHDDAVVYRLPYETGKSFTVMQGYGGNYSHKGASRFCVDFRMPEGTNIVAARTGRVVGVYDKSNVGGPSPKFRKSGNRIIIGHSDGTLGEYWHLRKNGASVRVGDRVSVGQVIGTSGNTGFSSEPHLHFGVYSAINGKTRISHPITFSYRGGSFSYPRKGHTYQAN